MCHVGFTDLNDSPDGCEDKQDTGSRILCMLTKWHELGADDVTQTVQCLPDMYEALGLIASTA